MRDKTTGATLLDQPRYSRLRDDRRFCTRVERGAFRINFFFGFFFGFRAGRRSRFCGFARFLFEFFFGFLDFDFFFFMMWFDVGDFVNG